MDSNCSNRAGASGAEAERTKRTRRGAVSPSTGVASREMMAGTALIHVTSNSSTMRQNAVRWNRSSRTSEEPATSVDSSPTTSALMCQSGSGLNPRSERSRRLWSATSLATPSNCGVESVITFGAPVVPEEARTTPPSVVSPLGSPSSSASISSTSMRCQRNEAGAPGASTSLMTALSCKVRPRSSTVVACWVEFGSSGATQRPAEMAARNHVAKVSGSLMASPTRSPRSSPHRRKRCSRAPTCPARPE